MNIEPPVVEQVSVGSFKESVMIPYILYYMHPKHGGTTGIQLSLYVNGVNRLALRLDRESASTIRKGLSTILSKSIDHPLVGLEADRAFRGLYWMITPAGC